MGRILVVGYQGLRDDSIGLAISLLRQAGCVNWAWRIRRGEGVEHYDMKTLPERGDAMDAIGVGVDLVVALNLCGMRGEVRSRALADHYSLNNIGMLVKCRKFGVVLAAVGQFPTPDPGLPTIGVLYVDHVVWRPRDVDAASWRNLAAALWCRA